MSAIFKSPRAAGVFDLPELLLETSVDLSHLSDDLLKNVNESTAFHFDGDRRLRFLCKLIECKECLEIAYYSGW